MKNITNCKKGFLLWPVMVAVFIAVLLLGGLSIWLAGDINLTNRAIAREEALRIAEAGIDYYLWRLSGSPEDYLTNPGPIHQEFMDDGIEKGFFNLEIIPPSSGSSAIKLRSQGVSYLREREVKRTIEVVFGVPSLARYAVLSDSTMRFYEGAEIFGPIHSNDGIRFDGIAHGLVSSAVANYSDPDHGGGKEFGVHTHVYPVDPLPPAEVPLRPDVFKAGRQFPVPAVDFSDIISDMAIMKTKAQNGGHYIDSSGESGYRIFLKEDNSYDLFKVTNLTSLPSQCNNNRGQSGWGSWSIAPGGEEFLDNFSLPDNSLIFVEDDVWVEGKIDKARITIVAGRFPEAPAKWAQITVNNNLLYTNYDGQDLISLIAQGNINTGWESADNLRIDAVLVSQNGRVGQYYFKPPSQAAVYCGPHHIKDKILIYGMVISKDRYGFSYTDGTGYQIREIHYDNNLFYNPPSFLIPSDGYYGIISWREVK
ncbi:MAG TPA: hypothetical protein ENN31_02310 [Candidatus Vogelbacteria bacterium]|nr:hypothetical protein [Candidatus Vogelbacteria bacterium]